MFPSAAMCVRVAAELRLADLLADGPLPVTELASRVDAAPRPLSQALRILAVEGVFAEVSPGVFANTPRSTLLREGVPDSQYVMSGLGAADWLWASYGELGHSIRTGGPGFEKAYGTNLWAWLGRNPGAARQFNEAMAEFSATFGPRIVASYTKFGDAGVVADLGGGTGAFVSAILRRYPAMHRGVLVDQPSVIEQAKARADHGDLIGSGRMDFFPGDFFADVPTGIDVYTTKQITHSWSDAQLVSLLKRCRDASPDARFAAAELVQSHDASRFLRQFDIMMYATMAGFLRTEDEYADVFAQAGYRLTAVVPTGTAFSIIEAEPC
jgi:DNA-binding Lrp family transcriptional regulator